jgi:plasmid stability protein
VEHGQEEHVANLTLNIDAEVLRAARIRALEQGTSVNAIVRDYLVAFAATEPVRESIATVVALARTAASGSGAKGRSWSREDLHDR